MHTQAREKQEREIDLNNIVILSFPQYIASCNSRANNTNHFYGIGNVEVQAMLKYTYLFFYVMISVNVS